MFLNRVTQWLEGPLNYGRVINIFTKFDSDGDNLLSSDDFFVAMRMMEVCNCCFFFFKYEQYGFVSRIIRSAH